MLPALKDAARQPVFMSRVPQYVFALAQQLREDLRQNRVYLNAMLLDELVHLCLSTNHMPEITEYPDSGKVGVLGGADWNTGLADFYAGKDISDQYFFRFYEGDTHVNYFTGEIDE